MKVPSLLLALASTAALSGAAKAGIMISGNLGEDGQVSGGFVTYTLTFTATSPGGVVAGFVGNLAGNVGFETHSSGQSFSQQFLAGVLPTPTMDLNAAIDESKDTQFLVSNSNIISTVAPFESLTTLGGAFTLNIAARAREKSLIQIVMPYPPCPMIRFDFSVAEAIGAGLETTNFAGLMFVCPEPPSSSAAILSGVILSSALGGRRTFRRT